MSFEAGTYRIEQLIAAELMEIGDGYRAKNSELSDQGIPFARAANINHGFKFESADWFPLEALPKVGNKISRPGDVVFTSKGTVGRFALVSEQTQQFVYSPQLCFWRSLAPHKLLPEYLYYWMNSAEFLNQIGYLKGQTDMADYVSLRDQRKITATIPTTAVQRAIIDVIKPLDDRIVLLRETNATLEAIAQALFKSWFVDFDPVHAKQQGREPEGIDESTAALFSDSFEESELGLVPKGWKTDSLSCLTAEHGGTIQTGPFGSQLHASDYVASGIPVVMPKDIKGRRVMTDSIARILEADADRLDRHKLKEGDIIFSRRGDVERHALIGTREAGWICGTGCLLVRPGNLWPSSTFLSMTLDAPRARNWLVQHAVGATMPNLNTGILGSVPVLLPPNPFLQTFENVIAVTEAKLSHNSSTAETLAALRDTLLPRLISGQLRLPDAEAMLEEPVHDR